MPCLRLTDDLEILTLGLTYELVDSVRQENKVIIWNVAYTVTKFCNIEFKDFSRVCKEINYCIPRRIFALVCWSLCSMQKRRKLIPLSKKINSLRRFVGKQALQGIQFVYLWLISAPRGRFILGPDVFTTEILIPYNHSDMTATSARGGVTKELYMQGYQHIS